MYIWKTREHSVFSGFQLKLLITKSKAKKFMRTICTPNIEININFSHWKRCFLFKYLMIKALILKHNLFTSTCHVINVECSFSALVQWRGQIKRFSVWLRHCKIIIS